MKQVYLADRDQNGEALLLCQPLARTITSRDFEERLLALFRIWLPFVVEVGEAEASSLMDSWFCCYRFPRLRSARRYPQPLVNSAAFLF